MLAALLMGQTATAQSAFSPRMNTLRSNYQTHRAASADAAKERIGVVVTCSEDASAAEIANKMIAQGAVIRALMGNQLVVDLPMAQLDAAAAIEGVMLIDQPQGSIKRTDTARKATHVDEVHAGMMAGERDLPQAYTGKGVIIGLLDSGFDYTHPIFKDKEGNLRIKGVYEPFRVDSAHTQYSESLANIPVTDEKGVTTQTTLTGSFYTDPKVILNPTIVYDKDGSHGTHCASIAAGSMMEYTETFVPRDKETSGKVGGMAPDAELFLADMRETDEEKAVLPKDVEADTYNATQALSAMKYFADKQGKPLVVSWSMNMHNGFHDGTSTMARYVGNYCAAGNVMALCSSNEGGSLMYVDRDIAKDSTVNFSMTFNNPVNSSAFFLHHGNKNIKVDLAVYSYAVDEYGFPEITIEETLGLALISADSIDAKKKAFSATIDTLGNATTTNPDFQQAANKLTKWLDCGTVILGVEKGSYINQENKQDKMVGIAFAISNFAYKKLSEPKDLGLMVKITSLDDSIHVQAWGDYTEMAANFDINPRFYNVGSNLHSMGDWNTSGKAVTIGAYASTNESIMVDPETGYAMLLTDTTQVVGSYGSFSSFGHDFSKEKRAYPDVSAPGVNIYAAANSAEKNTSYMGSVYYNQYEGQDGPAVYPYAFLSGTSMATPAAAGIIALWMQAAQDKGITMDNDDIKEVIRATSDNDEFTQDEPLRYGAGKINAYKGLLYILDLATSIPELPTRHIGARLDGRTLRINGNPDVRVVVYNLSGHKVLDAQAVQGVVQLPMLTSGVYAVKIGNQGSTLIRL